MIGSETTKSDFPPLRRDPEDTRRQDSLRKRYGYKLFANFFGLGIGFVTQAIITRGLGPKAYGDFNFLTNFFNQVVSFLEMGTATAFYTKLSQRQNELSLVSFYFYFSVVISLTTFGFFFVPVMTSTRATIWPDQALIPVFLAALFGIMNWVVAVLNTMADAYGVTVRAEVFRIVQKILGLVLIACLFVLNLLNLTTFFLYQYAMFALLGLLLAWSVRRHVSPWLWRLDRDRIKGYVSEFYQYSNPLFTYSLVGLVTVLFDRWLLQTYCGSVQQGFYGLSFQISALCFLFTGAMTPLFIRELSIAYGNRDFSMMRGLFHRYIPLLYSISAYFSCFIVAQTDKVVYLFGGEKFSLAAPAVAIMALYPLHQTYGQLSGSVFLASGQTSLYRNIGLFMMIIGLPITYFMIAPHGQGGLDLGAKGLAIKMVIVNIIWVNIQLFYNARYLKFSLGHYLRHQLTIVLWLMSIAFLVTYAVDYVFGPGENIVLSFLVSGTLYSAAVFLLLYTTPNMFGIGKDDVRSVMRFIRDKLVSSRD